jgi:SNF2 family DNA or RNA helicase
VLTGTPAPNGYEDLFNLFHFIWPEHDVIKFHVQHLRDMSQNPFDPRIDRLVDNLSPFFIRIRKSDLHLPKPIDNPIRLVRMGQRQDKIYRFIEQKYVSYWESKGSNSWVKDALAKARVIRLMQAATNPALLRTPLDEALLGEGAERTTAMFVDDAEILAEVQQYASNETPAKLEAAVELVQRLLSQDRNNRIVVWCVFIANLFALRDLCEARGIDVRLLYGGTPTETDDAEADAETREKIVDEFQSPESSFRVVLANPAAVGESISLHKTCRHAIYVERNFNAAAFLQSKDRIHRYGLPQDAKVNYHYLVAQDTVDSTIHERLLQKEAAMMKILESRDIPLISLNMDFGEGQDDSDDVRAIIRDYVKRRTTNAITG